MKLQTIVVLLATVAVINQAKPCVDDNCNPIYPPRPDPARRCPCDCDLYFYTNNDTVTIDCGLCQNMCYCRIKTTTRHRIVYTNCYVLPPTPPTTTAVPTTPEPTTTAVPTTTTPEPTTTTVEPTTTVPTTTAEPVTTPSTTAPTTPEVTTPTTPAETTTEVTTTTAASGK